MCDLNRLINLENKLNSNIEKLNIYFQVERIVHSTRATAWWIKDINSKFLNCNQATCDFFFQGLTPNHVYMKDAVEVFETYKDNLENQDINFYETLVKTDKMLLSSKLPIMQFYEKLIDEKGNECWFYVSKEQIPPIVASLSEVQGIYGVAVKIPNFKSISESSYAVENTEKISDSFYLVKQ